MKFALLGLGLAGVSALTDTVRHSVRQNFGNDKFITLAESQLTRGSSIVEVLAEVDQFGFRDGEHHLRVSPEVFEQLQASGIIFEDRTEEFLSDVERNFQDSSFVCSEGAEACAAKPADEFYESYHTRATYHKRLENLAAANPEITTLETLGTSFEGREQKIIKIGDDGSKPLIFYFCAIHAREWLTPPFCLHLVESLLDPNNVEAQNLLKVYSFAVTPVANPDGFDYTHNGDNFWRKTRKPNSGSNCMGTDPNRNWGFEWGGVGASTSPCSDTYRGTEPFDQECVFNIKQFVDANQDRLIHINDVHSYGEYYLNPWGWTDDEPPAEDFAKMKATNQALYDAIRATTGTRFKVGPASTTIYPASGGSMDYFYGSLGIVYSGVYEARDGGRGGLNGFQPPTSNIKPSNMELFAGLYALADKVYEIEFCADFENSQIYSAAGEAEESCENIVNYCSRSQEVRERCAVSCNACSLEEVSLQTRSGPFFLPNAGQPATPETPQGEEEEEEEETTSNTLSNVFGVLVGFILVVAAVIAGLLVARRIKEPEAVKTQQATKVKEAEQSTVSHYNV